MDSGWIILDKPSGITSRAAGGRVARMFGVKKFGHLGTLDPMASGVLPIALGEATKMIPYLECRAQSAECSAQKEYLFSIKWGIQTDTDDITGKIIKQNDGVPTDEQILAALPRLAGEIEQMPPAYSAVHIDGKRAYELARRGIEFEMPKRKVTICDLRSVCATLRRDRFAICNLGNAEFKVQCSAGTYVRTLAQQIADEINRKPVSAQRSADGSQIVNRKYICTCNMIRRTRTHMFEIKDAVTLDFMENLYNNNPQSVSDYLKPVDFGLDDILVIEIEKNEAELFQNGGFITPTQDSLWLADARQAESIPPRKGAGETIRRIYSNGKFIGIGILEKGLLKPKRIITTQG